MAGSNKEGGQAVSETPRTDAEYDNALEFEFDSEDRLQDMRRFSKKLERELNAANAEIEEKRKDVVWLATEKAKLENYVMLLEEWGDYMRSHSNNEWWCENWDKAKEAKP
jgi:predicted  nucleic acid-binding Zn-ribbon protein